MKSYSKQISGRKQVGVDFPASGIKQECPVSPILLGVVLEVLAWIKIPLMQIKRYK